MMEFSHFHNTQVSVATDSGFRTASDAEYFSVSHPIFDCGKSGICGRRPTSRNPSTVDRVKRTFPYKSQLCILFQRGKCYWGEKCRFAHSLKEIGESGSSDGRFLMDNYGRYQTKFQSIHYRPEEDRRKTKLCNRWERFGKCPYGLQCCFAHGVAELRKCSFHDDLDCDTTNASRFKVALQPCEIGIGNGGAEEMEPRGKRRCMKWSIKKMSQIYADWIV